MIRLLALVALFIFAVPAQAQWGDWDKYISYYGYDCDGSQRGVYDTREALDAQIANGAPQSWKGWNGETTAGEVVYGPCENEWQITGFVYEHSTSCSHCSVNDEEGVRIHAKAKLMEAYNCNGPNCSLIAGETYHVQVYANDFSTCPVRRYHWTVAFVSSAQEYWPSNEITIFDGSFIGTIIHGSTGGCFENLNGQQCQNNW